MGNTFVTAGRNHGDHHANNRDQSGERRIAQSKHCLGHIEGDAERNTDGRRRHRDHRSGQKAEQQSVDEVVELYQRATGNPFQLVIQRHPL